jgi:hypothetical protein
MRVSEPLRTALRIAGAVALVAVFIFAARFYVAGAARPGHAGPLTDPIDFSAFYCAGAVLAHHEDPYRSEPLRSCEGAAFARSRIGIVRYLVVPAPLPPYALALFSAVSFVPFRAACEALFFVSIASIAVSTLLIFRLSRVPLPFVAGAVIVSVGIGSLFVGQLVPVVLAALCASGLALRAGRPRAATCFALVTLLEPHVGLAAVLGLFVLDRRTRGPLVLGLALIASISFAAGGWPLNVEYLAQVLPAHARSEIGNFHAQYGLSSLLYALGAGSDTALRVGAASYVAMVAVGIALAKRLSREWNDISFAVLTPPACALVGGVFVHDHQMALALPFAFLLARYAERRALVFAAIAVLAVPWQSVFELFLSPYFPSHVRFAPVPLLARVSGPSRFAEDVWRAWIVAEGAADGRTPLQMFLFKLPTWLAFFSLGIVTLDQVESPRPALRSLILR